MTRAKTLAKTLTWHTKSFGSLSNSELYSMLRLRSEVFVVEQDCVYLDLDNYDQKAHHLIALDAESEVLCCARIVAPGIKYAGASIGRIVTSPSLRGSGKGKALVREAINACCTLYPDAEITISAQQHLEAFYAAFEFKTASPPYLEDGIPHIQMTRDARS